MFFRKRKRPEEAERKEVPPGLWIKCDGCGELLFREHLPKSLWVCPKCGHHFRIPAKRYVEILLDGGAFEEEITSDLKPGDPLGFPGYREKLQETQRKTGLLDAAIAGTGKMGGIPLVLFVTDFGFMGGSMGSVVGEKFFRATQRAVQDHLPLVAVTASGGGARMHEGVISLMQMVKTIIGVEDLNKARLPYINVLVHPTMGGVMASFASLGDLLIAEPGALLGFAGPRVIRDTIGETLPEGFQRSEFLLEHGMIDMVVDRRQLRATLIRVLSYLKEPQYGTR